MKINQASVALLIANLIPVLSIFVLDVNIFSIFAAYWLELLVVGLYSILKISKAQGSIVVGSEVIPASPGLRGVLVIMFIFQSLFILALYGFMILMFFSATTINDVVLPHLIAERNGFFNNNGATVILVMMGSFIVSHGVSYAQNFIGTEEYKKISSIDAIAGFGFRVLPVHIMILVVGFIALEIGFSWWGVLIFMIIKTIIDYIAHVQMHEYLANKKYPVAV